MKLTELTSLDPDRQEIWEHNGHKYSIVDLVKIPLEANGSRATDQETSKYRQVMSDHHGTHHFEVAELTDYQTIVLNRFPSIERCRAFIESGDAEASRKGSAE